VIIPHTCPHCQTYGPRPEWLDHHLTEWHCRACQSKAHGLLRCEHCRTPKPGVEEMIEEIREALPELAQDVQCPDPTPGV
jgi:primosomal protein N'